MGDSFVTVIAIFLAAILMFIFPLMSVSERKDDVSQLMVETATTDFVDNVRTTGKLTSNDYDKFMQQLVSTGNSYDVEMQAQLLDENGKIKTTQAEITKIGENVYYNLYTTQIEEKLNSQQRITFKEGDLFSTTVKNTNQTIAQILRNFMYQVTGNGTYQIAAQHGGMITVNGTSR